MSSEAPACGIILTACLTACRPAHGSATIAVMTTRHYLAIAGLLLGIAGLAVAVMQPLQSPTLQWAAFFTGIAAFIAGMAIAASIPSEPVK